jgi:DNA polymerase I-like protein with 3'-5' exonuclease and polymerase domains
MKQMSGKYVFDIEADDLLLDATEIYCGVIYDLDTKKYYHFRPHQIDEMVDILKNAHYLVGHNICGYDLPLITKLYGIEFDYTKVRDTLLLSKLVYYNKDSSFSHSLEAWGERLGEHKLDYKDFSQFTEEMLIYNEQDVRVNVKLFNHLISKAKQISLSPKALIFEQQVQKYIIQQHLNGWYFDTDKAEELEAELRLRKAQLEEDLQKIFKPLYLPKGNVKTPKKPFKRNGVLTAGQHQPIEYTPFNPASGKHIHIFIEHYFGKQKWKYTEKGTPKTDAKTLMEMFKDKEWAKELIEYFDVNKLLGMLADGDNAWLKLVRPNHRIHHEVDILGANTGRATHRKPNLAQVPKTGSYKGEESRELFRASPDKIMVGCDLSGVELRCLAHYLAKWDNGEYAKQILEGDIHTYNQQKAGLPTRDNAKTFIYGWLYGAGDAKIGEIVGGSAKEGRELKERFLKELPAVRKLQQWVKNQAQKGYLIGITGRRLYVRSMHSALNLLLQSLGAYISKQWIIVANQKLQHEKIPYWQLGWIHDELQMETYPEYADKVAKILEESAVIAGELLKLNIRIDAEARIGKTWKETH